MAARRCRIRRGLFRIRSSRSTTRRAWIRSEHDAYPRVSPAPKSQKKMKFKRDNERTHLEHLHKRHNPLILQQPLRTQLLLQLRLIHPSVLPKGLLHSRDTCVLPRWETRRDHQSYCPLPRGRRPPPNTYRLDPPPATNMSSSSVMRPPSILTRLHCVRISRLRHKPELFIPALFAELNPPPPVSTWADVGGVVGDGEEQEGGVLWLIYEDALSVRLPSSLLSRPCDGN